MTRAGTATMKYHLNEGLSAKTSTFMPKRPFVTVSMAQGINHLVGLAYRDSDERKEDERYPIDSSNSSAVIMCRLSSFDTHYIEDLVIMISFRNRH